MVRTIEQKLFRKASEIITKLLSNKKCAGFMRSFKKQDGNFCFIFEISRPLRPDNYPIEGIFSISLTRKSKEENYIGLNSHLYEYSIKQLDIRGKVLKNIGSGKSSGHGGGQVICTSSVTTESLDNFWDKLCGLQNYLRPK